MKGKILFGTDAERILYIALQAGTPAKVRFEDDTTPPCSGILHPGQQGKLTIGQPEPDFDLEGLYIGQNADCSFTLRKVGFVIFSTQVTDFGKEPESFVEFNEPDRIELAQRRQRQRITPSGALPAQVQTISGRDAHSAVRIENISVDGACLSFPNSASISSGVRLKNIALRLAYYPPIELTAIVRCVFPGDNGRFCLGVQWEGITRDEYNILVDYIMDCQHNPDCAVN